MNRAPEYFLVAVDRATGRIAGFLNGLATDESTFRDEFFTDAGLHDRRGRQSCCWDLTCSRNTAGQGLASELMRRYLAIQKERGKKKVLLTCLDAKVEMYKKMDFRMMEMADSSWGGEAWHEMSCAPV